ncbi:HNH endonuclease [Streptomyces sp. NPDC059524]|uniref:HNH endonuclease n=1 Tax=Streptomyces sp. NPDC059524 TaxID=3346856 RepID=UPI00367F4C4B
MRYVPRADNTPLKLALLKAWNYLCHMCQKEIAVAHAEIDHIVPRSLTGQALKDLKDLFGLNDSFDLDDPMNLAPICRPCNMRKGDETFDAAPALLMQLKKARRHRDRVIRDCKSFGSDTRVARDLQSALKAELSSQKAKDAFLDHAPEVVQRLANLDADRADYVKNRVVELDEEQLEPHDRPIRSLALHLRSRGRETVSVLEDLCGHSLTDLLAERMTDLEEQICARIQVEFPSVDDWANTTAGPPVMTHLDVGVDGADYERYGPAVEFTFQGSFESYLTASLVQDSRTGDGLQDRQGEAEASGTFSFTLDWAFSSEPGDGEVGECTIEDWDSSLYVY